MAASNATAAMPPEAQMLQMIMGKFNTLLLHTVAELGIADLLKDGPKPVDKLASEAGVHPAMLYRVLRALAFQGVFAERVGKEFALTPKAETLRSDVPGSMRGLAIWLGCEFHNRAWANISHVVRTGESNFQKQFGMTAFEYMNDHPEDLGIFQNALTQLSEQEAHWACDVYDFTGLRKIVDVGGGNGMLLARILSKYPDLTGVLYDQPKVVEGAHSVLESHRLGNRYEIAAGDFFETIPEGGDAYTLKHIIHDWDDERCRKVLENCRAAMAEGGRVLVLDQVIPEGNEPHIGKLFDIEMMVVTEGGIERTEGEFQTLFASAGLKLNRIVGTEGFLSIVEGVRG